jgi:hypothetical protein
MSVKYWRARETEDLKENLPVATSFTTNPA